MFDTGFLSTSNNGADDSFIAALSSGISQGLQKIGSEVLPNWAASQLKVQQTSQLDAPTLNAEALPPRAESVTPTQQVSVTPTATPTLWDTVQKNYNISSGAVLMAGIGIIGLVVVLKVMR